MRAIETRQKQIAEGLAAGEQGRQNLVTAEKRVADMIAEAKAQGGRDRRAGREVQGRDDRRRRRSRPPAEGERIIAAAKAEIAAGSTRAREQLRNQVADLAVAGAEKILKREVDAEGARGPAGDDPAGALDGQRDG